MRRSQSYRFGTGGAILFGVVVTVALFQAGACLASAARVTEAAVPGVEEIPAWQARWELARVLGHLKRCDEAAVEYRKLLQEKPALTEAREELARALLCQGRAEEALAEVAKIPPAGATDGTRELAADLHRTLKQYEKGESLYRGILERSPDNHRVRLKLAELLSWAKRYDESLAEYRVLLAKHPRDVQIRRKYAFVLIWAGRHAEAAQELRRTLP